MLNILILFVIIFLILSKLLDCISTSKNINDYNEETNPLTKTIMRLLGINKSIYFVFIIALLIILICGIFSYNTNIILYKLCFILLGIFISIIQFSVSYANFKGRNNIIINNIYKFHILMDKIKMKITFLNH